MEKAEFEFEKAMHRIYFDAKRECHYNAIRYKQMIDRRGGLPAAHHLLETTQPENALMKLCECGRMDLTVEFLVLKEEFRDLFTDKERDIAQARLDKYLGKC